MIVSQTKPTVSFEWRKYLLGLFRAGSNFLFSFYYFIRNIIQYTIFPVSLYLYIDCNLKFMNLIRSRALFGKTRIFRNWFGHFETNTLKYLENFIVARTRTWHQLIENWPIWQIKIKKREKYTSVNTLYNRKSITHKHIHTYVHARRMIAGTLNNKKRSNHIDKQMIKVSFWRFIQRPNW